MSCRNIQNSLSAFLDSALSGSESDGVAQHLAGCRDCASRARELEELRHRMRSLPRKAVPAILASRLQVLASHERARRATTLWQRWLQPVLLLVNNLMRPIAIPFVGGVSAALVLFSMLTPYLTIRAADARTDLPFYWLYTQGTIVDTPPFSFPGEEVEVLLTIDKNGQITDYACADGKFSRQVMDNIGNSLLFSSFEPPTMFGLPSSGKIRVTFKKIGDHIVVRG
jgi:putative zinc finger protein